MKRVLIYLYGLGSYVISMLTLLYAIGFLGNIWVPRSIDSPRDSTLGFAFAVDLALLLLFALQHSVMARPAFKQWWTRIIPAAAERSTYVLFSSVALMVLFACWHPLGGTVWDVSSPQARIVCHGVFALGWGVLVVSTFLINHFDLFGMRQVTLHLLGRPYSPLPFRTPFFYRYVRHPIYVGWLLTFWATPTMTIAHLVFAVGTTVYILVAIGFEERDLVAEFPEYEAYRAKVPMLIPSASAHRG